MRRLAISEAARADLDGIASWTEARWGAAQRQRYLRALEDAFLSLLRNPGAGKDRGDVRDGYRCVAAGKHMIFYRDAGTAIEIVRVLHERMDLHRQLGGRDP